jgi:hypothetical protein
VQYKPIRTTRFVVAGTIEERILKLQEKKQAVFEGTVGEWGQDTTHAWCLCSCIVNGSGSCSYSWIVQCMLMRIGLVRAAGLSQVMNMDEPETCSKLLWGCQMCAKDALMCGSCCCVVPCVQVVMLRLWAG